ncbi:RagB/SusD family nutrient uptake outer membrane protein [Saccharicrinis aurantiacus]|uniref:RagB/SusD family nutrient uptake outer membrane protein n=1 Tax=Saccharicrinis aurantiacus TaxID=1849719 RepID=UPI00248FBB68|nr:RagB/SusD family nutrient uptake outer membrane protein [Saccharicrinis aurantiacus]
MTLLNHIISIKLKSLIIIALICSSCSHDWLNMHPSDSLPAEDALKSVSDVDYALNGAYNAMLHHYYYGGTMLWIGDVRANDMMSTSIGVRTSNEYRFQSTADNISADLWSQPYVVIKATNSILYQKENIEIKTENEQETLNSYIGEAYALRALALFDLTRLFGKAYKADNGASLGVPIVTELLNPAEKPGRSSVAECYQQIISDFKEAITLLANEKHNGRITQEAANTLLARVYLYMGEDELAYNIAKSIIDNTEAQLIAYADYENSWKVGLSSESIFELVSTSENNAGGESMGYVMSPSDGYGAFHLSSSYLSLIKEIDTDIRAQINTDFVLSGRTDAIKDAYLGKYPGKDGSNYVAVNNHIIARLSEVYLIAAEAAFKTNKKQTSLEYLNTLVEKRTELVDYYALDDYSLVQIMNERRKELVGEGHNYFDALRDGETLVRDHDNFFGEISEIDFNHNKAILPIPRAELNTNPIAQNPGY